MISMKCENSYSSRNADFKDSLDPENVSGSCFFGSIKARREVYGVKVSAPPSKLGSFLGLDSKHIRVL